MLLTKVQNKECKITVSLLSSENCDGRDTFQDREMYAESNFPRKYKGCRCGGEGTHNEELENCTEIYALIFSLETIMFTKFNTSYIETFLRENKRSHKRLKKQRIVNFVKYYYWLTVLVTATLHNYVSNQIMCMNSLRNHEFSASTCNESSLKKHRKADYACKVAKGRKKKRSFSANHYTCTSPYDYSKTVSSCMVTKKRQLPYKASTCVPNIQGNSKTDYPNNLTKKNNVLLSESNYTEIRNKNQSKVYDVFSVANNINRSFISSSSTETGVNQHSRAGSFLTKKTNELLIESNHSKTDSKDQSKTDNCYCVAKKTNYSLIPSTTTDTGVKNDTKADNSYSVSVRATYSDTLVDAKEEKGNTLSNSSHTDLPCYMEELVRTRHISLKPCIVEVCMVPDVQHHPSEINRIPWNHLKSEKWRLVTFSRFPHNTKKSAILLAEQGFAYMGSGKGNDDLVICCFCCVPKKDWLPADDVNEVHRNLSPDCSMITKRNCDNVPLQTHSLANFDAIFSKLNHNELLDTNNSHIERNRGEMANIDNDGDDIEDDSPDVEPTTSTTNAESHRYIKTGSTSAAPALVSSEKYVPSKESARASTGSTDNSRHSSNIPNVPAPFLNPAGITHNPSSSSSSSPLTASNNQAFISQTSSAPPQNSSGSFQNSAQASGAQNSMSATGIQSSTGTTNTLNSTGSTGTQNSRGTTSTQISTGTSQSAPSTSQNPTGTSQSAPSTSQNPTGTSQSAPSTSQNPAGSSENTQNSTGTAAAATGKGPTYGELGIITERPKRIEYAVKTTRLSTFDSWPRDHHLKKEDLADAGFYYAGYGDCARCFYCGGGLRNWENDDNVWVEHARWFPKCAHIRQTRGQQFVDAVQDLNKTLDKISLDMVRDKLGNSSVAVEMDYRKDPLRRDPAVLTVKDLGYTEEDILEVAKVVKETLGFLSADILFEQLQKNNKPRGNNATLANLAQKIQVDTPSNKPMDKLKEENNQLRQQTACKVCMDKEVAVVFLPCGHLVCCADCASAMKDCPVCRKAVRGIVRAFMG